MGDRWRGITRPEPCSGAQAQWLSSYLRRTAVPGYAFLIDADAVRVWRCTIEGRAALGSVASIFRHLSSRCHARRMTGRETFLVKEVRDVLHRADCADAPTRAAVDALVRAVRAGTLRDRTITIVIAAAGPTVVDGNKRAAAIYETATEPPALVVPVFVLERPGDTLPF